MSLSIRRGSGPSASDSAAAADFPGNIYLAQVKTSYTFDFFGAAFLADRALAQQIRQQAFQLESTRRELAANIVTATINVASLQEQVAATEQLVALGEQRAQQIAARYKLGSASHDEMLAAGAGCGQRGGDTADTAGAGACCAPCAGRSVRKDSGPGARATDARCLARARHGPGVGANRTVASTAGHPGGGSCCESHGG